MISKVRFTKSKFYTTVKGVSQVRSSHASKTDVFFQDLVYKKLKI